MSERNNESLIPRPPLKDEIKVANGQTIELTRENTTLIFHLEETYRDMDHVHIKQLGNFGVKLFGLYAWTEHLITRGYDILFRHYPDDVTVATWLNLQSQNLEKELDGAGGELDDLEED